MLLPAIKMKKYIYLRVQAAACCAPSVPTPYIPCGHRLQATAPSLSIYVPGGHGTHIPRFLS